MCSIGEIFLRWKFWYTVVVCLQSGYMDMQEAMEGEETPDIAHRLQQTNETMQNIARNLGAVDQETRANTGTLAEHSAMLQGIL